MNFIKRNRLLIVGLGLVVLVGGFLAFRPDKLFVDDAVNEQMDLLLSIYEKLS